MHAEDGPRARMREEPALIVFFGIGDLEWHRFASGIQHGLWNPTGIANDDVGWLTIDSLLLGRELVSVGVAGR